LTTEHITRILKRAAKELCEDREVEDVVSDEVIDYLADLADGDGTSNVKADDSEECVEYV
jgi:replication-associated recombination protein RarA